MWDHNTPYAVAEQFIEGDGCWTGFYKSFELACVCHCSFVMLLGLLVGGGGGGVQHTSIEAHPPRHIQPYLKKLWRNRELLEK